MSLALFSSIPAVLGRFNSLIFVYSKVPLIFVILLALKYSLTFFIYIKYILRRIFPFIFHVGHGDSSPGHSLCLNKTVFHVAHSAIFSCCAHHICKESTEINFISSYTLKRFIESHNSVQDHMFNPDATNNKCLCRSSDYL